MIASQHRDDRHLSQRVADEAWLATLPLGDPVLPDSPLLVMFAGIPLCGKTTIARALVATAPTWIVHAENDALRERAAMILDRPPQHDPFENFVTYQAAWTLISKALQEGMHAIHDATNLTESGRRKAYAVAESHNASVFVVFVLADRKTLDARAQHLSETRRQSHKKYHGRNPDPTRCSKSSVVLDGARDVEENLEILRSHEALQGLWPPEP